jgi:hypothetical protein
MFNSSPRIPDRNIADEYRRLCLPGGALEGNDARLFCSLMKRRECITSMLLLTRPSISGKVEAD